MVAFEESTKTKSANYQLKRSQSHVDLLRYEVNNNVTAILPNRLRPSLGLTKCASTPDLAAYYNVDPDSYISDKYIATRHRYFKKYSRDWNLFDEYFWDKRHGTSDLFWPTRHWPNRRYYYHDKHYALWAFYPDFYHFPKYNKCAFLDSLDPVGWYRNRDPSYDFPYTYPYRPWTYVNADKGLSAKMYKQNLINYPTLERNWLVPHSYQRWCEAYGKPFCSKPWLTSPRRYFYKFDNM